jgi:hypothetical protein
MNRFGEHGRAELLRHASSSTKLPTSSYTTVFADAFT